MTQTDLTDDRRRASFESDVAHRASKRTSGEARVDVGIPTLGNSPYLAETIESVLAQTFTQWTLTISENGPGLESMRALLAPYLRDERVRHIVTGTKLGRGTNHNVLVAAGDAPFVALIHDDDRWHPEFLERHVRFLDDHVSAGFVFSGHVVIDEQGRPLGRTPSPVAPGLHTPADFLPRLYRNNFIGCPTVVVRRTAYDAVEGYPDLLNYDMPMWLRLASRFDVGYLEAWDAEYRHHPLQASSRRTQLAVEHVAVLEEVADVPVRPSLRRLALAESYVRCSLDAMERGERSSALSYLGRAVRCDPIAFVRPHVAGRALVALVGLAPGRYVRSMLSNARSRRWHAGGAEGLLPMPDTSNA